MNNLFRITKDNVENFLIEYNKNKLNIKNIKNIKNDKNDKNNHKTQILQKETKIVKDNLKNEKVNGCDNNLKHCIKIQSNDKIIDNPIDNKMILEYGKSGIKLDKLKKIMKNNLKILFSIDEMIKSFIDYNPNLKLNTLLQNNITSNKNTNTNINKDKKIHWNENGFVMIETNELNVIINDKKNNKNNENNENNEKNKKYNLIDFGYIKIYDVNFTEEFLNKNKIPSLNSIITFSENIKHFLKLIKILNYTNKYKIKINQMRDYNLMDIIYKNLPSIISNINEKKNLFNSIDKNFTFYIKILQTNTSAFIIDKKDKILYYFNSIENNNSGYIFFYVLELDSKYKIINLNNATISNKIIEEKQ